MPPLPDTSATDEPGFAPCPVCGHRRWRFGTGHVSRCRVCDVAAREADVGTAPCGICGRTLETRGGYVPPCEHCRAVAARRDALADAQAETVRRRRERS